MKVMECDTKRRRLLVFLFTAGNGEIEDQSSWKSGDDRFGILFAATAWVGGGVCSSFTKSDVKGI